MEPDLKPKFNGTNHYSKSHPMIKITKKTGVMIFNQEFSSKLNFNDQDSIEISQDQNKKTDWYIKRGGEVILRHFSNGLVVGRKRCAMEIMESTGTIDRDNVKFIISTEPVKVNGNDYYAIITRNPQ